MQPDRVLARQPPCRRAACADGICSQALPEATDGAGNSNLCLTGSPPSPAAPWGRAPGCPSARAGHLGVTSLSRPAAAAPRTPACTGARWTSPGRGGMTGGICQGQRANSSWAMPCWGSGGCRRGQAAPCSSSLRPGEGMKSAGGENPACTRTLLLTTSPATALERYTTLQQKL